MNQPDSLRYDFEQAMGESFAESVSPPIPFDEVSAHECCEVIWSLAGRNVTPTSLATLTADQIALLSTQFGAYFDSAAPSAAQITEAIAATLARWPVGSLGEV